MDDTLKIRFRRPAARWVEAVPLGNGRMGLMCYGNPSQEKMDLSEVTCFSGEQSWHKDSRPGAPEAFRAMREEILRGDYKKARQWDEKYMGVRNNYGTNLPAGHLRLDQGIGAYNGYAHTLWLERAVSETVFTAGGVHYRRTAFLSNPQDIAVIRLEADCTGAVSLLVGLDSGENPGAVFVEGDSVYLSARAVEPRHSDGKTGVSYGIRVKVIAEGGAVAQEGQALRVAGADHVTLLLAVRTSFGSSKADLECREELERAAQIPYETLLQEHEADFSSHFSTVSLQMGREEDKDKWADELLEQAAQTGENGYLTALMYQFGRYLLLSASRENSPLPAHLQGVWNDNVACRIGWTCDMHLDINTQMNYWPSELSGLESCNTPLFRWITKTLVPSGRITAQKSYGLPGWCAELVSNAWGYTAPYWHPNLSPCPGCGAWTALHLWEHYDFSGDLDFLRDTAYPALREAAEFFLAYLFERERDGLLHTGPSCSPENLFQAADGEIYSISVDPTFEVLMIRELFQAVLSGGEALGVDDAFSRRLKAALDRLPPYRIGADGALREYAHDFPSTDSQHRHTSHLLGLYPYGQITPDKTPELAAAAQETIRQRTTPEDGWEDTGWARSMLMLYQARLWNGEETYRHIHAMQTGLTNPNLMVKHPPTRGAGSFADVYEMDGNTGLTACVGELLLQSDQSGVRLLPALPAQWGEGSFQGLGARGGLKVDLVWKDGKPVRLTIRAKKPRKVAVRYGGREQVLEVNGTAVLEQF